MGTVGGDGNLQGHFATNTEREATGPLAVATEAEIDVTDVESFRELPPTPGLGVAKRIEVTCTSASLWT